MMSGNKKKEIGRQGRMIEHQSDNIAFQIRKLLFVRFLLSKMGRAFIIEKKKLNPIIEFNI